MGSLSMVNLLLGDSLEVLKSIESNSIDSCVTDAPYGLAFMGKRWDYDVPSVELWREVLRVLKPGAHLLSFGGTRTYHRMVINIEDAGFEIKDQLQWNFGSGFPKSLNVYKAALKQGIICNCDVDKDHENRSSMRSLQEDVPETGMLDQADKNLDLQLSVQRSSTRARLGEARLQGSTGGNSRNAEEILTENGKESSMEGRGNLQENEGELHRAEILKVSERVFINGQERRLYNGASISDGEASESFSISERGYSPHGSQYSKQSPIESGAMARQSQSQISRTWERCVSCSQPIYPENLKGLGTALKPANEPICLARKPISEKTVASNVLKHGTGAMNIDESRIEAQDLEALQKNWDRTQSNTMENEREAYGKFGAIDLSDRAPKGRWPANVIFDKEAGKILDEQSGILKQGVAGNNSRPFGNGEIYGTAKEFKPNNSTTYSCDIPSGASRFFYCAKASKAERNAGCEDLEGKNNHPTLKPIKLMTYLIKLVTPPGGVVLDPFMGSGSTGVAAKMNGFKFAGIEREESYFEIAYKRINEA